MRQEDLFGKDHIKPLETKYTSKVKAPIYEPKNTKPIIAELINRSKSQRLISEIEISNVSNEEKRFLI